MLLMGFLEAVMDRLMGSESLMTFDSLVQMAQDREKEMRDCARTEFLLTLNREDLPSWYARAMTRIGDKLVVCGTWLKAHSSVQHAYRVH